MLQLKEGVNIEILSFGAHWCRIYRNILSTRDWFLKKEVKLSRRIWKKVAVEKGIWETGTPLVFRVNKHCLLDVQTHKQTHTHTHTCRGGRMKGVSNKHSSCVEWAALIVEKYRDVSFGWTRMWAVSVCVCLCVCLCVSLCVCAPTKAQAR